MSRISSSGSGLWPSAQDCEYVGSRSPAFLMTDEGEIHFGYTGS